jgi:hypothetical protein
MDTILNFVAAAGFVGSIALVAWGLVLLLSHGLDAAWPVNADARWRHTNLPAGTSL